MEGQPMREKTYHLYLNEEERSRVIQSLIELKNNLAAQGRYTDAVDDTVFIRFYRLLSMMTLSEITRQIMC